MENNNFENKMKQLSQVEDEPIMPDIVVHARPPMPPSMEELEKYNNGGVYSMGQETKYAPRPDDEQMYTQYLNRSSKKPDPMLAGLEDEYSVKKPAVQKNVEPQRQEEKKVEAPVQKKEVKASDANTILIENSKKEEVELELMFKAKIPVNAFFAAMDDAYVKKNQNALLTEIISHLKMNELDKQLKEKLKEFYGLK